MIKTQKRTLLTYGIIAVLFLSLGYSLHRTYDYYNHKPPQAKANVFVIFETAKGTWTEPIGNLITNIGERHDRNVLHFNNVTDAENGIQYIALGNSTIAAANTKLDTEATANGFTRAANDTCVMWMNGTDYAVNVTKKFTASGTVRVNATAAHWNGTSNSDNNCYAMASITATTFAANDNCTIVWVFTRDNN